jgi:RimJ/RimL family protein N-acetyltransferase
VPFELQPTLTGALLALRPLSPADFDALYAVASDPLIWEQHPARDRHEAPVFRQFFAEALASGGALLVTDVATGDVIGSSRYFGWREDASEIEIGWTFLARSHWGGRYNRELKRLMLDHAFRFVRSVVFLVGPGNLRSQRAMQKVGGRLEPEPDSQGRLVYRITASSWSQAP